MNHTPRLPRRRLLAAALGAAGLAAAAACTGPPENNDPPGPSSSPGPAMLRDDIVDGVTIDERGFATFPVPNGDAARRIVGAAAVFRNGTDQPIRVHVRFQFVDGAGRGWRSEDLNDWQAIVNAGWAYLPAGQAVELGGILQVGAEEAGRVARIVLDVTGEGIPPPRSVLLPARIDAVQHRPTPKDEWDYVSFDVDNPTAGFEEPNYGLVYRSTDGRLIGGWFVDRAHWWDIESALPKGESDEYPRGISRHTLPTWLPPDIQPSGVTMYVWPR
ncbi:hypothetical protein FHR83_004512 [Actinoplanes campanulatus]|uniref:Uncharacterized protein n=1 Tax=Actinoplanes campanulatus TaxID=113559 RepID=A0A7W5AID5_9ACTN|nr:hypothetical protein [Actinoplanes campanulatus]MBB3096838.1 hypothetical protein [Actinoplanes campanulatus]GGN44471.1 hypothetical protein GCM10010109_77710 [Actinoplanes campanulatus]GID37382.1 hypothetical protein Aca09nite_38880 [Actinoplanes campanulatus]